MVFSVLLAQSRAMSVKTELEMVHLDSLVGVLFVLVIGLSTHVIRV